jgi:hypothetical protein
MGMGGGHTPIVGAGSGVSPTLTAYNLDSRSPQSEEQQRIVNAVVEAQIGFGESSFGQFSSNRVSTLKASKGVLGGGSETLIVT